MSGRAAIAKNLRFWHWYPQILVPELSVDQTNWQPPSHDTSAAFALFHAYRCSDDLGHGMGMGGKPSVYQRDGWASRLAVPEEGGPFGNNLTREQIGALTLDPNALCEYAAAVGESLASYVETASDDALAVEVELPFFRTVYAGQGVDVMTRLEVISFFGIGHPAEHLGEVQMVRGLMGLQGAPL